MELYAWIEKEEGFGTVIKISDKEVWVKMAENNEILIFSPKEVDIVTDEEMEELDNGYPNP